MCNNLSRAPEIIITDVKSIIRQIIFILNYRKSQINLKISRKKNILKRLDIKKILARKERDAKNMTLIIDDKK